MGDGSAPRSSATPLTGTRWSPNSAKNTLRRHDRRHTGLTWMAGAGVPLHYSRKIAGHGSLTTTQRYLHPTATPSPQERLRILVPN
ncbi:tyrosine-type recombinase/integrase [Nonomuraea soli]|uniref:tyrosine-type recombinase/integrase n=1 Tax=Nonomuraea soli TaxID=1032476 RepID=UPI001C66AA06